MPETSDGNGSPECRDAVATTCASSRRVAQSKFLETPPATLTRNKSPVRFEQFDKSPVCADETHAAYSCVLGGDEEGDDSVGSEHQPHSVHSFLYGRVEKQEVNSDSTVDHSGGTCDSVPKSNEEKAVIDNCQQAKNAANGCFTTPEKKTSAAYTKYILKSSQKASGAGINGNGFNNNQTAKKSAIESKLSKFADGTQQPKPQQSFLWKQPSTVSALKASLKANPGLAKELLEHSLARSKPVVEIRRVPSRKSSIRGSKRKFISRPSVSRTPSIRAQTTRSNEETTKAKHTFDSPLDSAPSSTRSSTNGGCDNIGGDECCSSCCENSNKRASFVGTSESGLGSEDGTSSSCESSSSTSTLTSSPASSITGGGCEFQSHSKAGSKFSGQTNGSTRFTAANNYTKPRSSSSGTITEYRLSVAINKQTVAALASKFNAIIEQQQVPKNCNAEKPGESEEPVELRLVRSRAGVAKKIQSLSRDNLLDLPGGGLKFTQVNCSPEVNTSETSSGGERTPPLPPRCPRKPSQPASKLRYSRSKSISDLLSPDDAGEVCDDELRSVSPTLGSTMGLIMSRRQSQSNPDLLDDSDRGARGRATDIGSAASGSRSHTDPKGASSSNNRFWDSKIYGNVRGIVRSAMKTFERNSGGSPTSDPGPSGGKSSPPTGGKASRFFGGKSKDSTSGTTVASVKESFWRKTQPGTSKSQSNLLVGSPGPSKPRFALPGMFKTSSASSTTSSTGASDASVYASDISSPPGSAKFSSPFESLEKTPDFDDNEDDDLKKGVSNQAYSPEEDNEYQVPRQRVLLDDVAVSTDQQALRDTVIPNSSFLWNSMQKSSGYEVPKDRRLSLSTNQSKGAKGSAFKQDVSRTAPPALPPHPLPSSGRQSLLSKVGQSTFLWRNLNANKFGRSQKKQETFYSCTDVDTIMEREFKNDRAISPVPSAPENEDPDKFYQKIDSTSSYCAVVGGDSRKYLEILGSGASSVKYEAILGSSDYEEAHGGNAAVDDPDGGYDNLAGIQAAVASEQYLKLTPGSEQYLKLDDSASSGRYEKVGSLRDSCMSELRDGSLKPTCEATYSENYADILPADSPFTFEGMTMTETSIAESLRSELMECINPLFQNRLAEFHRRDQVDSKSPSLPPVQEQPAESEDGVVLARLAMVRDQEESLNYVYDDATNAKVPLRVTNQGYETIDEEKGAFDTKPIIHRSAVAESEDECCGVHEVTSYQLKPPVKEQAMNTSASSSAAASKQSPQQQEPKLPPRRRLPDPLAVLKQSQLHQQGVPRTLTRRSGVDELPLTPTSSAGDDWVDVDRSDDESHFGAGAVVLTKFRIRTRSGRAKGSNKRSKRGVRRSWSKSLRDFQQNAHSTRETSKTVRLKVPKHGGEEASDEDESSTEEGDHTYESLYDVIGSANRLDRMSQQPGATDNLVDADEGSFDDDMFDDSFDSASEDEAEEKGGTLTKENEGLSEADLVSSGEAGNARWSKSISTGQKIRKKLRRNWSLTKSDIREGFNRIRKKSTSTGPISPFSALLPLSSSNDADFSEKQQPCTSYQAGIKPSAQGPAVGGKKANWSLKSHFKKKSMSASSLKPIGGHCGGERKESSMFYLTLTIKSDEQPDAMLRRLEGRELAEQMAAASCQSLPENPERPRRRRSDADSESARSNSSGGHGGRIQSPSGESNSSSTYGSVSDRSNGSLDAKHTSKTRSNNRLSGKSISRPKMAPPDPPKGASPRRSFDNPGGAGPSSMASRDSSQSRTSLGTTSGGEAERRRHSSIDVASTSTIDRGHRLQQDQAGGDAEKQCHKRSSHDVSTGAPPALPHRPGPAPKPPSSLGVRFKEPPPRTSRFPSSPSPSGSSSSSASPSSKHYDRPFNKAERGSPSEPPPLPPVPPSLRGKIGGALTGGGKKPQPGGPNRFGPPPAFQESHYVNPCHIFAGFDEDSYVSSQLADEPLYQFYTATVLERATQYQGQTSCGEDDYEVIEEDETKRAAKAIPPELSNIEESDVLEAGACAGPGSPGPSRFVAAKPRVSADGGEDKEIKRMSALAALELAGPRSPHRTLWCELPQVIDSGVLDTMSAQEKKLQEAIFEVITSEASYLKSLNILVRHFMQCSKFSDDSHPECVLTRRDRDVLFSDILPVRDVSEALLCDLEKRWAENIIIEDISDIILAHAQDHFGVYVKYCSNKIHQDRLLNSLKETSPLFCEVLRELESDPVCQSLSMHSFLMLPMQRITRLPLLIDAIFHRLPPSSVEYENCKNALTVLNKVVHECNEGARKMERLEELLVLSRQLDFGAGVKALPLMSASRWLVKRGQLTRLLWKDSDTMKRAGGLGKSRPHKQPLHLFLFTDVLIITKKKGTEEPSYTVLDYCSRNMIQIQDELEEPMLPGRLPDGINKAHVMLLTLLENREGKTVEMILACPGDSERARWTEAVTPRRSNDPNEVIYEEWDCPQVQAIHPYTAQQPDELSLETSDVVNVFKKTADGWYQGERIRDGERGWFPGNFCEEIASAHVRARNLRQRYRLLVLSGSYLEEKRRISVGKQATFYVPIASEKRRERKSASSVFTQ